MPASVPDTGMTVTFDPERPGVTVRRRLSWMDTDAAARWHYTVVLRWAEDCEAELHRALGVHTLTFGWTPRVAIEADFAAVVTFDDVVDIDFWVAAVGHTSVTYAFDVHLVAEDGSRGKRAGGGKVVTVYATDQGPAPWPDELRGALLGT